MVRGEEGGKVGRYRVCGWRWKLEVGGKEKGTWLEGSFMC